MVTLKKKSRATHTKEFLIKKIYVPKNCHILNNWFQQVAKINNL
jgi:hypothetical protein